jgi:MbtH protein
MINAIFDTPRSGISHVASDNWKPNIRRYPSYLRSTSNTTTFDFGRPLQKSYNLEENDDMDDNNDDSGTLYYVVINGEEQYSIWRADKEVPRGWSVVGEKANKQWCLDHIKEVWTDMRPLSLRKQMEEASAS